MDDAQPVFNRRLLRVRRDIAIANWEKHDFLCQNIAEKLIARLEDFRRNFNTILELGCQAGQISSALLSTAERKESLRLVSLDLSTKHLEKTQGSLCVQGDEEKLPFAPESFDAVVALLNLHLVNNLPDVLLQIRQILKPDGVFLAALIGQDSLAGLRHCLVSAEQEWRGGAAPRIVPMLRLYDLAALLQRAGFALPMADCDRMVISYKKFTNLLADLKGMAQNNICYAQPKFLTSQNYWRLVRKHADQVMIGTDNSYELAFDILFVTAWCPHPNQQQPARRGSGQIDLSDIL